MNWQAVKLATLVTGGIVLGVALLLLLMWVNEWLLIGVLVVGLWGLFYWGLSKEGW